MLISSMTYEEIYRAISIEMHDVFGYYEQQKPKVDRALKKATHFPFRLSFKWEHPKSHNMYYCYVQSNRPAQWHNPFMSIYCEYEGKFGKEIFIPMPIPGRKDLLLQVFTAHFYSRYGERFLKNENDYSRIVMLYMARNFEGKSMGKDCVSTNEQQTETPGFTKESILTIDGLSLGLKSYDNNIIIYKTFVSFDQLFQAQYEKVWQTYLPYVCELAIKSSPRHQITIRQIYESGIIKINQLFLQNDKKVEERNRLIFEEYEHTYNELVQYIM